MTEFPQDEELKTVPELLGFLGTEDSLMEFRYRVAAYSKVTYRSLYLLYEDEVEDLFKDFAPDRDSAKDAHQHIHQELQRRFGNDREYKCRVLGYSDDPEIRAKYGIEEGDPWKVGIGGYNLMQMRMEDAGVVPAEEKAAVDTLNKLFGDDR